MLLVDSVHALTNVVIVDPTQVDLVSRVAISHGVVTIVAAQANNCFFILFNS
jgi:hypothetical protein